MFISCGSFFVSITFSSVNITENVVGKTNLKHLGLDLAACYSQKCEWVFQIFPFLQVI